MGKEILSLHPDPDLTPSIIVPLDEKAVEETAKRVFEIRQELYEGREVDISSATLKAQANI